MVPVPPTPGPLSFSSTASHSSSVAISSNLVVHEALTLSIPVVDKALKEATYFRSHAVVSRFFDLWSKLSDLNNCTSKNWNPLLKGEAIICPCARGFFIVDFKDNSNRDHISESGLWFWGSSSLFMQPWSPSFDPATASISLSPVWVRLPNLPLHLWCPSLGAIGNTPSSFHSFNSDSVEVPSSTYARICIDVDF